MLGAAGGVDERQCAVTHIVPFPLASNCLNAVDSSTCCACESMLTSASTCASDGKTPLVSPGLGGCGMTTLDFVPPPKHEDSNPIAAQSQSGASRAAASERPHSNSKNGGVSLKRLSLKLY